MRVLDRVLVCCYLAVAGLPAVAMIGHWKDHRLFGAIPAADRPALSFDGARSGDYQAQLTTWFEQAHGLRNWSIWIDNTILAHVFGETKPGARVQLGREGMLFEYDDIYYFNKTGAALPAPGAVNALADRIAALQTALRLRHRALVPVFVPSKTTLYRDHVPALWTRDLGATRPTDQAIYRALKQALEARHVTYVDEIDRFARTPEPREHLWGPQARHFSSYAACLCVRDTLVAYARLVAAEPVDYPCQLAQRRATFRDNDLDLYRLLNAWRISPARVAYHARHDPLPQAAPPHAPDAVWIASSFGWLTLADAGASRRFGSVYLDYYNRALYDVDLHKRFDVVPHTAAWREVFLTRDLYVLELNETYVTPGSFFGDDAIQAIAAELDAIR
jgi:hypothetical protein